MIRFGILGAGRILAKYLPAFALTKQARLVGIASRRGGHRYASYEELIADPEVDVVINALHNGLHCEWTVRALEAGKHVLCEKPLACSSAEVERMFAAAHSCRRWLMEAFMYRFHPQIAEAKRLVEAGAIGRVQRVASAYVAKGREAGNPRYWPEAGGGALMDLGCYCVNFSRLFAGEPRSVKAEAIFDKVDLTMNATLAGDVEASFSCSLIAEQFQIGATITGTEGTLEIPHPWLPPRSPAELILNGQAIPIAFTSPFALELEHFCECVRHDRAPQFPPGADAEADSRANMRVIEMLLDSARR
jgi:xylose dehydrogenase (NAD/NADP)